MQEVSKVCLQDARVRPVQRMVSEETTRAGSAGLSGLGLNGGMWMESKVGVQTTSAPIVGFTGRNYSDFRFDEPDEPANAGLSLADYVVTKGKGKGRQKKPDAMDINPEQDLDQSEPTNNPSSSTMTTTKCPVCEDFEGDDIVVAHHVNQNFD